jgi:hypothetical protein
MLPVLEISVLDPISVQPIERADPSPASALNTHPASSFPPRRTSPLENRRVMKMRPLHILPAALPGTRAVFCHCRTPKHRPFSGGCELLRRLQAVLLGRHWPPLAAKLSVSLDIVTLRFNSANRNRDYVAHSAAEEVLQDLNESTPERRRWFRCRRNVESILKPTPEI